MMDAILRFFELKLEESRNFLVAEAMKLVKQIPGVQDKIIEEYSNLLAGMEPSLKPYRGKIHTYDSLPNTALAKEDILQTMRSMAEKEQDKWQDGFVSGAVYHGEAEHIDFLNQVYAMHSQANPLHADLWPAVNKYEAEVISMTAKMLGAEQVQTTEVCGAVSSGGTESILLAMKTYRDYYREKRNIQKPEMVLPVTAHAAFLKACLYFGIKPVRVPMDKQGKVDAETAKLSCNANTIVMVGSAPTFPHGVIDPIAELSEFARKKGIGFHTDACLGGFVLPWAEKLGYPVPLFDFRLPGVTSMSVDTHKYGYAAKGTSVVLYRSKELRHFQYFTTTEWPGGMYFSPTFAGSRPGALSASAWAAMLSLGEQGYMQATEKIMQAAATIKFGIQDIPEISLIGDPLWNLAFRSESLNIYRIMEEMSQKGWSLNGLHKPSSIHICLTLRHCQEGVAERFVEDLQQAVQKVKENLSEKGEMAPVYGMAASIPDRTLVSELLQMYMDKIYEV
ncbi:MAG: aminotransferase class V-fold PLP-dependent enzyme [Spirochaetota bacterium]